MERMLKEILLSLPMTRSYLPGPGFSNSLAVSKVTRLWWPKLKPRLFSMLRVKTLSGS